MSDYSKQFEEWGKWTSYMLGAEIARLSIFMGVMNNLGDIDVQQMLDWRADSDPEDKDGDYRHLELCRKVSSKFSGGYDAGYSHGYTDLYSFTSQAVKYLGEQNKEEMRRLKLEKIERLKKEIEEIEKGETR